MNFLELTSYIGEPQGYADFPEFQSDVWPLLRRKANEIESVFIFAQPRQARRSWPGRYEPISERIARLSPTSELTQQEFSELQLLSFYAGHLNVIYQISTESSLLRELCALYPVVNLSSDDIDQLGIDPEPLAELRAFTDALPPGFLNYSFSHDGDPLFVFGPLEALRSLLRTYYALKS